MLFELHLTIAESSSRFKSWSAQQVLDAWVSRNEGWGYKPLLIGLHGQNTPENPRQLMNAIVFERDSVEEAVVRMAADIYNATCSGYDVVRAKLEVPLDHSDGLDVTYYEAHAKLLLTDSEIELLIDSDLDMHASQNLLKKTDAGHEKWYMTKRSYGGDMFNASAEFAQAYTSLAAVFPPAVLRFEKEAVLIDTNPQLDNGWAV